MYRLALTDNREYEIIVQGFFFCTARKIGIGEWDTAVDLGRKIKSIGTVSAVAPDGTQLYDLVPAGGTMTLTKPERNLLVDMIENVAWKPGTLEIVMQVRTRLKDLPWESEIVK